MNDKKIRYVAYLSPVAVKVLEKKRAKIESVGVPISDSVIINSIIEKESKK